MTVNNGLLKNTVFLYILTFSNYLFLFMTVPYQTRIFGPEIFGILGFATAFSLYFSLIIDFGFILSATKQVSQNANDKNKLSQILTSVSLIKLALFILMMAIFTIAAIHIEVIKSNFAIMVLYLILAGLNGLIPDYIYRGLEKMKMITIRTVIVRFLFTVLIFVFLKDSSQIYLVPIFQICGAIVALIFVWYDLVNNYNIRFAKTSYNFIRVLLFDSMPYFLSRIASSIYSVSNTVILGFIYPAGVVVGLYSSADKIKSIAGQACSPIADSLYPYLLRTKDYSKMFKIVTYLETLALIGCIILWLYSDDISVFVFGDEFIGSGQILRYMVPIIAITLPSYIFGFPALSPLGVARWANYSVEIAMINQIIGLIILFLTNSVTVYSLLILTFISELICLSIRVVIFKIHYKRQQT